MTPFLPLPPSQAYRAATFHERGVAVPFTTPILAATRARHGSREQIELVVPNPSGGRGFYILACKAVRSLCCPTVHDSRLNHLISEMPLITPTAMRLAALEVAASGLAGKRVQENALSSIDREQKEQLFAKLMLLGVLAAQIAPDEFELAPFQHEQTVELQRQAHKIVTGFATATHQSPDTLSAGLDSLAEQLFPLGVIGSSGTGRIPRLMSQLTELQTGLAEWMRDHPYDVRHDLAEAVASSAAQTMKATELVLAALRAVVRDALTVLGNWSRSRGRVVELAARPDWLVDGWDLVCAIWRASDGPDQHRAAIVEMTQLTPVMPREIAQWSSATDGERPSGPPTPVELDRDWRTGPAALQLTARSERLRALAV